MKWAGRGILLLMLIMGAAAKPAGALPGQTGPTGALLKGAALRLTTRRTEARFPDGNRIWKVELHRDERLLASWTAASGIAERQTSDRRWSPGNAAPLPAGNYRLGRPEPWGHDLWFDLQPRFKTTRSALGIHRCYPGTGVSAFLTEMRLRLLPNGRGRCVEQHHCRELKRHIICLQSEVN